MFKQPLYMIYRSLELKGVTNLPLLYSQHPEEKKLMVFIILISVAHPFGEEV